MVKRLRTARQTGRRKASGTLTCVPAKRYTDTFPNKKATIIAQNKKGMTGMPTIETANRKVSGANRTNSRMPMKNEPTGLFSKVSTHAWIGRGNNMAINR